MTEKRPSLVVSATDIEPGMGLKMFSLALAHSVSKLVPEHTVCVVDVSPVPDLPYDMRVRTNGDFDVLMSKDDLVADDLSHYVRYSEATNCDVLTVVAQKGKVVPLELYKKVLPVLRERFGIVLLVSSNAHGATAYYAYALSSGEFHLKVTDTLLPNLVAANSWCHSMLSSGGYGATSDDLAYVIHEHSDRGVSPYGKVLDYLYDGILGIPTARVEKDAYRGLFTLFEVRPGVGTDPVTVDDPILGMLAEVIVRKAGF